MGRKLLLMVMGLLLVMSTNAGAVTKPEFTMVSSTSTTITINLITVDGDDSLLVVTGPDSVAVVAVIAPTDTTGNYTITGLTPLTQYIWRVKADSSTNQISSEPDTMSTGMNFETDFTGNKVQTMSPGFVFKDAIPRADSWAATNTKNTTFTLTGESDTDSSVVLSAAQYTNIQGYCEGDSCKFTILIYQGEFQEGHDDREHYEVLVDSLNVTAAGAFVFDNLNLSLTEHYLAYLRADTDNASGGTTIYLWQYRYKD